MRKSLAVDNWPGKQANGQSSPLPQLFRIHSPRLIPSSVANHLLHLPLPLYPHLPILTSGPHSLLYPSPQLQQAFPGNPQATPAREAARLLLLLKREKKRKFQTRSQEIFESTDSWLTTAYILITELWQWATKSAWQDAMSNQTELRAGCDTVPVFWRLGQGQMRLQRSLLCTILVFLWRAVWALAYLSVIPLEPGDVFCKDTTEGRRNHGIKCNPAFILHTNLLEDKTSKAIISRKCFSGF